MSDEFVSRSMIKRLAMQSPEKMADKIFELQRTSNSEQSALIKQIQIRDKEIEELKSQLTVAVKYLTELSCLKHGYAANDLARVALKKIGEKK